MPFAACGCASGRENYGSFAWARCLDVICPALVPLGPGAELGTPDASVPPATLRPTLDVWRWAEAEKALRCPGVPRLETVGQSDQCRPPPPTGRRLARAGDIQRNAV